MQLPQRLLVRLGLLYLALPVLIFCASWLAWLPAVVGSALLCLGVFKAWRSAEERGGEGLSWSWSALALTAVTVAVWVALSGIGGLAFQNADFHSRNAILRDLVNLSWPVKYHTNPTDPSTSYTLTYYIGFWLPAALAGKIAGWLAANIALYVWSVMGIILTLFLLASKVRMPTERLAVLFVLFSGMDGLGTLAKTTIFPNARSPLWPPIYHLEWWIPGFQYSSLTTQLFWVFNQAIPAWLCMTLLLVTESRKSILLIWSLCCFFAPLPALGMIPYVVLKIPRARVGSDTVDTGQISQKPTAFISLLMRDVRSLITIENVAGGGVVLGISLLYFLPNIQSKASASQVQSIGWVLYAVFVLFEGLLLWWIFRSRYKTAAEWYVVGALLMLVPLIQIGDKPDFCMRASIPTLFMLLVWSAETLVAPRTRVQSALVLMLCVGAVTPIYEINRSIYRTASYFLAPPSTTAKLAGQRVVIYTPSSYEFDHPYTLTADSFKSLANVDPEQFSMYLARSQGTLFEAYLSR